MNKLKATILIMFLIISVSINQLAFSLQDESESILKLANLFEEMLIKNIDIEQFKKTIVKDDDKGIFKPYYKNNIYQAHEIIIDGNMVGLIIPYIREGDLKNRLDGISIVLISTPSKIEDLYSRYYSIFSDKYNKKNNQFVLRGNTFLSLYKDKKALTIRVLQCCDKL